MELFNTDVVRERLRKAEPLAARMRPRTLEEFVGQAHFLGEGKLLWRMLKADGYLNEKFPGGLDAHKALLEAEGFTVVQKGKRYYVPEYQDVLFCDFEDA